MEIQFKHGVSGSRSSGFDGTQVYNMRPSSSSSSSSSNYMQTTTYILRATTMALTFVSAIVMATGKDTARVSITNPISMKTTNFVETVKARYSSSLVYFIVVNVFMFLYSASSLAASLINKASSKRMELTFKISDILFLILLFSSNGSAITTSLIIQNGNVNLGMIRICGAVGTFCAHVAASIVLSMFGSLAHLAVILLEMIGIYNED